MLRRVFLKTTIFLPTLFYAKKSNNSNIWKVIEEVQEIYYPASQYSKGAKRLKSMRYLKENIFNKYFLKQDRDIIFKGAKFLLSSGFLKKDKKQKEKFLKKFAEKSEGKVFTIVLLRYTLEGIFSDPIYGGNDLEDGWREIDFSMGNPRPKCRYGKCKSLT